VIALITGGAGFIGSHPSDALLDGGREVIGLKHASKKKLVVIASTSEVYGKSVDLPFREDSDLVLGPTPKHRWAYACSKAIDEFWHLPTGKRRHTDAFARPQQGRESDRLPAPIFP
jgi:nucleoside-diphosphate-sugar epimerase